MNIFTKKEIYQSKLDLIIPELKFKKSDKGWRTEYKLNGEKTNQTDKTVCYYPCLSILEQGEKEITVIDYLIKYKGFSNKNEVAKYLKKFDYHQTSYNSIVDLQKMTT